MKIIENKALHKVCTKCRADKERTNFGISKGRKDGLRPWCKQCHNEQNRKWRNNNPAYYKNRHVDDPDRRKKYDFKYQSKNPMYMRGYYEEHKAEFIGRVIKRRNKTSLSIPLWADRRKMRTIYRIATNLNRLHGFEKYHVDHIVPLQGKNVSGLHVHTNLRILLAEENKSKFNKWTS